MTRLKHISRTTTRVREARCRRLVRPSLRTIAKEIFRITVREEQGYEQKLSCNQPIRVENEASRGDALAYDVCCGLRVVEVCHKRQVVRGRIHYGEFCTLENNSTSADLFKVCVSAMIWLNKAARKRSNLAYIYDELYQNFVSSIVCYPRRRPNVAALWIAPIEMRFRCLVAADCIEL